MVVDGNGAVAEVVEGVLNYNRLGESIRYSFFAYHFIDCFNRLDQRPWSKPFSVKKIGDPCCNTLLEQMSLRWTLLDSYCFALTLRYPSFGFILVYPYPSQWFIVT